MAVCLQTPFGSKTGLWNMSDLPTEFSTTGSDAVSDTMAYQFSLPPLGDSPSSMIPSLHHLARDQSHPSPTTFTKPLSPGDSAAAKAAKVKRSISTPNVRGQASADAAALALSAEKKRNKLGYHRTSVACGHCRRRKIRCIPAPADPQNRCSNCIRLKKECNFYPVDQQPQPEPKRRSSKTQSGTGRMSEESSPSTSSGPLPEIQVDLPYPHLNMAGPQMKRQRTESFSPENKAITARGYEFNPGATNWMAPDLSPGGTHQAPMPQSYWGVNPQDSPMTPAFSPFTPSLQIPPAQNWVAPHTEPSPRDDLAWAVPQRSISYSNLEGLQNNPQYGSNPQTHPNPEHYSLKARSMHTGMYPPPISTSVGGHSMPEASPATSLDTPQLAHSAGTMQSHYSNWQQPYAYQKPVVSGGESYDLWSAHSAPPQPTESRNAGHLGYGYGDPTGGSFYPPPPSTPGR